MFSLKGSIIGSFYRKSIESARRSEHEVWGSIFSMDDGEVGVVLEQVALEKGITLYPVADAS